MDYTLILSRKYNAEWVLNDNDYDTLIWLSDSPKPTKGELDALWDEVQADIQAEKLQAKAKRDALLERLGITDEEAFLLAQSL